jgi:hypothetical protein
VKFTDFCKKHLFSAKFTDFREKLIFRKTPIFCKNRFSGIQCFSKKSGFQGAALSFTGIAEKLRDVWYSTHQAGKWNVGMRRARDRRSGRRPPSPSHKLGRPHARPHPPQNLRTVGGPSPPQTGPHPLPAARRRPPQPWGRGYQSSLFYFDYDTWFYNGTMTRQCGKQPMTDLSTSLAGSQRRPGRGLNNTWACSPGQPSRPRGAMPPRAARTTPSWRAWRRSVPTPPAAPDVAVSCSAPHAPHDPC